MFVTSETLIGVNLTNYGYFSRCSSVFCFIRNALFYFLGLRWNGFHAQRVCSCLTVCIPSRTLMRLPVILQQGPLYDFALCSLIKYSYVIGFMNLILMSKEKI